MASQLPREKERRKVSDEVDRLIGVYLNNHNGVLQVADDIDDEVFKVTTNADGYFDNPDDEIWIKGFQTQLLTKVRQLEANLAARYEL